MHGAVARNPAHGGELGRTQRDVEMRFAAFAPTAMATVALAVIFDLQQIGCKSGAQPGLDFITNPHGVPLPLQSFDKDI
jgi:hypothetical protein